MYSPEDSQQHVGRARIMLYQRQIRLFCVTWLPFEGAGQSRRFALIFQTFRPRRRDDLSQFKTFRPPVRRFAPTEDVSPPM